VIATPNGSSPAAIGGETTVFVAVSIAETLSDPSLAT
jgi:hypothetical protein